MAGELLVRRFYDELWNKWRLEVADEILAEDIDFRGSLGSVEHGRDAFKRYVERVRVAFPDWHNQVDELFAAGDRVVARLTWSGTIAALSGTWQLTGNRVSYVGVGLFTVVDDLIRRAWIVGDTQELWRALRAARPGRSAVVGRALIALSRRQRLIVCPLLEAALEFFRRRRGCAPRMPSDPDDLASTPARTVSCRRRIARGQALAVSAAALTDHVCDRWHGAS